LQAWLESQSSITFRVADLSNVLRFLERVNRRYEATKATGSTTSSDRNLREGVRSYHFHTKVLHVEAAVCDSNARLLRYRRSQNSCSQLHSATIKVSADEIAAALLVPKNGS